MPTGDSLYKPAFLLLSLFGSWLFIYSAWISDDALISLRQVVMLVEGHGMVWNLGQRVQAFSHTSWFFLLSFGYLSTGSLFYMTLFVSWACVAGALCLYWRYCRAHLSGLVLLALMALPLSSAAFRDYMSSGLENPLSLLLAAGIITLALKPSQPGRDTALWLLFALAILTRQDHALHFGPLALWVLWKDGIWRQIRASLPGLMLLVAWFAFATFYFGAPLPNTYYAKLTSGVLDADKAELASLYLAGTLDLRLGTSLIVALGLVFSILASPMSRVLAVGIALHLMYLWSIGGDFMVGRFLTTDLFLACFILVDAWRHLRRKQALLLSALLTTGVASIERPFIIETSLDALAFTQVLDERLVFAEIYGLMSNKRTWPELRSTDPETQVTHVHVGCGFIGAARFAWPDSIHIIDMCGLTDPYMARLPSYHNQPKKAGHFKRAVPADYADVILKSTDQLVGLGGSQDLLARTWELSQQPLDAPGRLASIKALNLEPSSLDMAYWTAPDRSDPGRILTPNWIGEAPEGYPDIFNPSEAHRIYLERRFGPKSTADPSIVALQSLE